MNYTLAKDFYVFFEQAYKKSLTRGAVGGELWTPPPVFLMMIGMDK